MDRLNTLKFVVMRYYRTMRLRVLAYALLSLVATMIGPLLEALFGARIRSDLAFDSVTPVLTILASSMLAVSTFSLNIMVTAHRAAADQATPRMHRILLEDTTTQSVLAVFIGAFVYSLGSLVLYRLGVYPEDAAVIVMALTTLVVVGVILSLLRWINHLTTLGSLQDSLSTARKRAWDTLQAQARRPRYGAAALTGDTVLPLKTHPLPAPATGYLQLIDMAKLHDCLPERAVLYLKVSPGSHVLAGEPLGQVSGHIDDTVTARLQKAFTFGECRTHEQDAAFGLTVLSEIASKALSPGINDSGTAIEAVLILKSLLWDFDREPCEDDMASAPRVLAAFPGPDTLLRTAFATIMRDGAGQFEVAMCLRQSLSSLAASRDATMAEAARALSDEVLASAAEAGMPERDLTRLRAAGVSVTDLAETQSRGKA